MVRQPFAILNDLRQLALLSFPDAILPERKGNLQIPLPYFGVYIFLPQIQKQGKDNDSGAVVSWLKPFCGNRNGGKDVFHSACCGAGIGTEAAYQSVGQHRNSQGTNVIRDHIGTSLQISIGLDTA